MIINGSGVFSHDVNRLYRFEREGSRRQWEDEEDNRSTGARLRSTIRGMALRWKVLVALGALLIALAMFVDWPPPSESSLPETKSFLLFLGAIVGMAGLIVGFWRE
jgi:hypothetical protein